MALFLICLKDSFTRKIIFGGGFSPRLQKSIPFIEKGISLFLPPVPPVGVVDPAPPTPPVQELQLLTNGL